jgi:hypothetical protein
MNPSTKVIRKGLCLAVSVLFVALSVPVLQAQDDGWEAPDKPWYKTDYGPYLSLTTKMPRPDGNVVHKAKVIKLDKTHLNDQNKKGAMVFDTDLLRFAGAWTGGFMKLTGVEFNGDHGVQPKPPVTPDFVTPHLPGWSLTGKFRDPRNLPHGPIPESIGAYKGLYLYENNTVLHYRVGDSEILDTPSIESSEDGKTSAYTRTLRIGATGESLTHLIAQARGSGHDISGPVPMAAVNDDGKLIAAALKGDTGNLSLTVKNKRLLLNVGSSQNARNVKLLIWRGSPESANQFTSLVKQSKNPISLKGVTNGGPPRWKKKLTTQGKMGKNDGPYTVDTITVPYDNPWNSRMRIGGFDIFPDGNTAVVSTWNGDVWKVTGVGGELGELTWQRVATGLHQPLGLKIVDGKVYTHGRDQITRLHDLNGDGEFDYYESFNDDVQVTYNFHEFAFDLQTDDQGNFYFSKAGPVPAGGRGFEKIVPHHGTIMRLSPDGQELDVYASGLRAPNGIGISPNGKISAGGQEGTYVPTSYINFFEEGGYGTVPPTANRDPQPETYNKPLVWLPHNNPKRIDRSVGAQVWVESNKWGPLTGDMLHMSYGNSSLFKVMKDPNQYQGAVVRFPWLDFVSSTMRGKFHKGNGQLYVAGLKGWQTNATKPGGFERVRYTGKEVHMPDGINVTSNGIAIRFTSKLDPEAAEDPSNYLMEMWNVKWTSNYGSKHYKVTNPDKKGTDKINVKKAKLLEDGRTVKLTIPKLQQCTNYELRFRLKTSDGTSIKANQINGTVHSLEK